MDILLILTIVSAVVALFLLIIGLSLTLRNKKTEKTQVSENIIEKEAGNGKPVDEINADPGLTGRQNFELAVAQTGWGKKIASDLARADIKMRPLEYMGLIALSMFVITLIISIIGGFQWHVMLVGGVVGFILPGIYVKRSQTKRLAKFEGQIPDMLNLMVNGLKAGYSTLQSMESISREMPAPIADEFRRVIQETQLGISVEKALDNLIKRIPSADLDFIVTAMNVHREVGGNLADILDTISFTIRDRVRIKGEIRVLTSQVRYSGMILSVMPIGLMLILYLVDREYIMEYFKPENIPCGYIALGTVVVMIVLGYLVMTKMAKIEV